MNRMSTTSLRQSLSSTTNIMSMRIPTHFEEKEHVHEVHGETSSKASILNFLHSSRVQMTLMALLLLDVIVLFIELFIDAEYPSCHFIERDGISCCPSIGEGNRFLAEAEDHQESSLCEDGLLESKNDAGCDPHQYPYIEIWHTALFSITMTILCIFIIELLTMMVVLKPSMFFSKVFYVIDLIVVTVSIILEAVFFANGEEVLRAITGIIIFARCWRFIRIGHGLIDITQEYADLRNEKKIHYTKRLEELLREHNIPLPTTSKDDNIDEAIVENQNAKLHVVEEEGD